MGRLSRSNRCERNGQLRHVCLSRFTFFSYGSQVVKRKMMKWKKGDKIFAVAGSLLVIAWVFLIPTWNALFTLSKLNVFLICLWIFAFGALVGHALYDNYLENLRIKEEAKAHRTQTAEILN